MKKLIQLLAVALMAFYACGCKPSSIVKGQVYVIMNGGNSVKMAGVQVFLIEETALRNHIKEINADGGFEAALKIAHNDAAKKAQIAANLVWLMLQNPETKGFHSTTTGVDGDFSFNQIPAGNYLLSARGSREVFGTVEYYLWCRHFSVKENYNGNIYTADLQNDFNVMTDLLNEQMRDLARTIVGNRSEVDEYLADKTWIGQMKDYGLSVSN